MACRSLQRRVEKPIKFRGRGLVTFKQGQLVEDATALGIHLACKTSSAHIHRRALYRHVAGQIPRLGVCVARVEGVAKHAVQDEVQIVAHGLLEGLGEAGEHALGAEVEGGAVRGKRIAHLGGQGLERHAPQCHVEEAEFQHQLYAAFLDDVAGQRTRLLAAAFLFAGRGRAWPQLAHVRSQRRLMPRICCHLHPSSRLVAPQDSAFARGYLACVCPARVAHLVHATLLLPPAPFTFAPFATERPPSQRKIGRRMRETPPLQIEQVGRHGRVLQPAHRLHRPRQVLRVQIPQVGQVFQ